MVGCSLRRSYAPSRVCGSLRPLYSWPSSTHALALCVVWRSVAGDRVRIDNAMRLYGFEYVGTEGDTLIYRAKGVLKRATFLFEDRLEVRNVEDGIEIVGIRRAVARVVYQLQAYIDNSRYEEK